MEHPTGSSLEPHQTIHNPTLQVHFTWHKWKAYISDVSNPSIPLYIVDFKAYKKRCIIVKSADESTTIGTGTLHFVSINPDYEIHGRKGTIKALKRWKTSYTHLSHAFASSPDGPPATMTWTSSSDFKTWDFVCLDEHQMPVAKYTANLWGLNKIGKIEFLGPNATSEAVRDEIIVTGLTLTYCMILRTTSLLSFFGAVIAQPGPIKNNQSSEAQQAVVEAHASGSPSEAVGTSGQVVS
ncbi:MAG: hypothetical protein Q9178_004712 [Gyalolechia marmorata]